MENGGIKMNKLFLVALCFFTLPSAFATQPNHHLTPGVLCTPKDADFTGYRYAEHIAYCGRNITQQEKLDVAKAYGGIPESEFYKYEFDHLIPLAIGGSNDIHNIWPQPIDEAKLKDHVEQQTYNGLNSGTMTQAQALKLIWDWVRTH